MIFELAAGTLRKSRKFGILAKKKENDEIPDSIFWRADRKRSKKIEKDRKGVWRSKKIEKDRKRSKKIEQDRKFRSFSIFFDLLRSFSIEKDRKRSKLSLLAVLTC